MKPVLLLSAPAPSITKKSPIFPNFGIRHLALAILFLTIFLPVSRVSAEPQPLLISAAASLRLFLDQIAKTYPSGETPPAIIINYGASGALATQITNGAPADLFISAASGPLDTLEKQNLLLPGTRRTIARNTLVLIVPVADTTTATFADLTKPAFTHIAIGEPSIVPAGAYAIQTLQNLGLLEALRPRLVLAKDVRQVLTYVETTDAQAGIVYRTDALASAAVRTVLSADPATHVPIIYPAAIIATTKSPKETKNFLDHLLSPSAQTLFSTLGYLPPE